MTGPRLGAAIALLLLGASQSALAECGARTPAGRYGPNRAFAVSNALVYSSAMLKVDADGAPDAYRVDGRGLSYTCDGVVAVENGIRYTPESHPSTWQAKCNAGWAAARQSGDYSRLDIFGFETRRGVPLVQGAGDPLPGVGFVSATSVTIPGQPADTQRRYVNANEIPYVVLPSGFVTSRSVRPGAVAAVYRPRSGRLAFAVYGDGGGRLDEASIRLHVDLGSDPIIVRNGVRRAKRNIEDRVLVALFPGVAPPMSVDAAAWRAAIAAAGAQAFDAWGGRARLEECTN